MARASTPTLLSLDRFAQLVGIHPLHFNQVQVEDIAMPTTCESPYVQYNWQEADRVGREEIAYAIAAAESLIQEQLRFKILPTWESDTVIYDRPSQPELFGNGLNIRGFGTAVKTKWGRVLYGGVESKSFLGNVAIVYADNDGDGYKETATLTFVTTVTDAEEIHIFHPTYNTVEYEMRPITVTIAAGVATVIFRREQCVLLSLMEEYGARAVDGLDDSNFLSSVDVWRIRNNASTQATLIWNQSNGSCYCYSAGCTVCNLAIQSACITTLNPTIGFVIPAPALWDAVTETFSAQTYDVCRAPERVRLYYRAGWQYKDSVVIMDPMWERAVYYLAVSLLDRPLCECDKIKALIGTLQEDMALNMSNPGGGGSSYRIPQSILNNPFGTSRGAIQAWRIVQKYITGEAVNA